MVAVRPKDPLKAQSRSGTPPEGQVESRARVDRVAREGQGKSIFKRNQKMVKRKKRKDVGAKHRDSKRGGVYKRERRSQYGIFGSAGVWAIIIIIFLDYFSRSWILVVHPLLPVPNSTLLRTY